MCRHRIGFARLMGPQRLHQPVRVMCPGGRASARQGNLRLTPSLRAGVRRGGLAVDLAEGIRSDEAHAAACKATGQETSKNLR
jgi:hypothetical protein